MNKLWLAACFALGILSNQLDKSKHFNSDLTTSFNGFPAKCYAYNSEDRTDKLDENWDWYEINDWWFFPKANIAVKRRHSTSESREGDTQYLVSKLSFRAMNGTESFLPYQFAVSGKTDGNKRRSSSRRRKDLAVYAELNGFKLEDILGGKDRITVSSSKNIVITRKVPFPIGETPMSRVYSISTDSGMLYEHKMSYFYKNDILFLQSPAAGDDSAQFWNIVGTTYWWEEFKPYKGKKSSSSQGESKNDNKKLRTELTKKTSLKERILGKWKIVKFIEYGRDEPMEGYLTFQRDNMGVVDEEGESSWQYKIQNDTVYLLGKSESPSWNEEATALFKNDTLILRGIGMPYEYFLKK